MHSNLSCEYVQSKLYICMHVIWICMSVIKEDSWHKTVRNFIRVKLWVIKYFTQKQLLCVVAPGWLNKCCKTCSISICKSFIQESRKEKDNPVYSIIWIKNWTKKIWNNFSSQKIKPIFYLHNGILTINRNCRHTVIEQNLHKFVGFSSDFKLKRTLNQRILKKAFLSQVLLFFFGY